MSSTGERVVLLTGFSDGIGKATALGLARRGFRQLLVGRDSDKSRRAYAEIAAIGPCEFFPCDLASLKEVAALAESIGRRERLDILINNAGVYCPTRRSSADGYELTFAVNHLAPFLLTTRLLDLLKKTAAAQGDAQIVNLTSAAYKNGPLDFDDLQHERDYTKPFFRVYSRSKLCNVYFTLELHRRLAGRGVRANCVHPGIVGTGIGRGYGWFAEVLFRIIGKSTAAGAATTLYLVDDPAAKAISGEYLADCAVEELLPHARDRAAAERLWERSADLLDEFGIR